MERAYGTPIHAAVSGSDAEERMLVEQGADLSSHDKWGDTAFHSADSACFAERSAPFSTSMGESDSWSFQKKTRVTFSHAGRERSSYAGRERSGPLSEARALSRVKGSVSPLVVR